VNKTSERKISSQNNTGYSKSLDVILDNLCLTIILSTLQYFI
jgi:hypothetical protein